MRTRSSRFFVVLLHLVGVSHHFRVQHGIRGVQPWPIVLEEITLDQAAGEESIWLQDLSDNQCLGPTARMTECGDATQWMVDGDAGRHRLKMGLFGIDDEPLRPSWTFSVLDADENTSKRTRSRRRECLSTSENRAIDVQVCQRRRRWWWWAPARKPTRWSLGDDGTLQSQSNDYASPMCLWRSVNSTQVRLRSCASSTKLSEYRKVQFALVRYRAVTVSPTTMTLSASSSSLSPAAEPALAPIEVQSIPHSLDVAHAQAMGPSSTFVTPKMTSSSVKLGPSPKLRVLHDTNPILLMGGTRAHKAEAPRKRATSGLMSSSSRKIAVHPYIATSKNEVWNDPQTGLDYFTDLCRYLGRNRKEHGRHTLMGVGQYRKGYVIKVYGVAFYVSKRDALADPALQLYAGLSADELRERPDFYDILRTMGETESNFDRTLLLKTNMQLSAVTMRNSLHADWQYLTPEAKTTLINSSMQERPADDTMLEIIQSPDNPSRCSCSQVAPPEYQADPECCARGTELGFTWLKSGELEVRLNGRIMDIYPRPDIAEGIFYEYLRYDDPISPELRDRVVDGFPFLLAPLAQVRGINMGGSSSQKSTEHVNAVFRLFSGLSESLFTSASSMAAATQSAAAVAVTSSMAAAKVMGDVAAGAAKEMERRRELLVKHAVALPETMSRLPEAVSRIPESVSRLPETISKFPETVKYFLSKENDPLQVVSQWVAANITPTEPELQVVRRDSLGRAFGYPLSRWFSETYQAPDEIGPMKIHPTMNMTRKVFLAFVHVYLLLLFIVSFPGSYTTRTKLVVRKCGRPLSDDSESISSDDDTRYSVPCLTSRSRRLKSKRSMFGKLRKRPSVGKGLQDELSSGAGGGRLKKKSLSYFL